MPVARSSGHAGRALLVSAISIVVLGLMLWGASTVLSTRNSADLDIGDATFSGGGTERLSKEIAERGPIIYSDVSGEQSRDMILQHLGDDPEKGWYAFLAAPPDKRRDCIWEWQPDEELFRAKCDESLTAPADGKGLKQFAVTVNDGRIDVDLNADERPSTTASTASTVVETGEPED